MSGPSPALRATSPRRGARQEQKRAASLVAQGNGKEAGPQAPERITDYTMKLISKARETSIQQQILSQADTIRYLKGQITKMETENRMQAERIAGLEAVLYGAGILDKDAVLASPGDKAWFADQVLERYEEVQA